MRKYLFSLLMLLAVPAYARIFPPDIRFGTVNDVAPNQVKIAQKTFRTAPGLRVFNQSNALIFVRHLPSGTQVGYQLDPKGELFQVWMLTAQELAERKLD
ncbi:MAG: hypothetical protein H6R07_273 [Proteobacteria bacterium]|nr:hypothetical protein [Pseudomonadota bacterium]